MAVPMLDTPTAYGPPKPSAVLHTSRLNRAPRAYSVRPPKPITRQMAMAETARRVSQVNSAACGVTSAIHVENHQAFQPGCPCAALCR